MAYNETCLLFEQNSMLDSTITDNASPIYRVSTNEHGSVTELRAAGPNTVLARIARKEILPDTVKFPDMKGGKSMRVSKWLKRTTQKDGL